MWTIILILVIHSCVGRDSALIVSIVDPDGFDSWAVIETVLIVDQPLQPDPLALDRVDQPLQSDPIDVDRVDSSTTRTPCS